jgi:hypothetical protein
VGMPSGSSGSPVASAGIGIADISPETTYLQTKSHPDTLTPAIANNARRCVQQDCLADLTLSCSTDIIGLAL